MLREEAQFNPQVPALGQQLPAAQEGASLRLGLCVTVAKVLNRWVKWLFPHEGQITLPASSALATRFSNSVPQSLQRYS